MSTPTGPFLNGSCENAGKYATSLLINIAQLFQITVCIVSLCLLALNLPFPCLKHKSIPIHKNLKIIFFNVALLFVLHSLSMLIVQLRHQISYRLYSDPCDLRIYAWTCLTLRIPINIAVDGFTFAHVALTIERSIASFWPAKYETIGGKIGILATIVLWATSFIFNFYTFFQEDWGQIRSYCFLATNTNANKMLIVYIILFVIDVCVTIGDFALTILNKKHMERKVYGKNHLSLTYQIQENMKTMQIIFPLSIAHSITFLIFLISTTCVRQFLQKAVDPVSYLALIELCNSVVAIYTCIIPLIFFKLRKKLKPTTTRIVQSGSAQTQEYFQILNKMYSKT